MSQLRHAEDVLRIVDGFAIRAEELLPNYPSLFSGQSGLSLLYSNLYLFTKQKQYQNKCIDILEQSIRSLDDGKAGCSLANGVAGVGWLIKYLLKKKVLSDSDKKVLDDFDDILVESLKIDSFKDNNHYDLLFGLIGKGVYFLEEYPNSKSEPLTIIFEKLKSLSVETEHGTLWYDYLGKEERNETEAYFNLGLAHGLPSIIIFLSKISKIDVHHLECKNLLKSLIHYLQKQMLSNDISKFPSSSKSQQPSRLAWCYGDIGVALAFIYAARVLEDDKLMNNAREIALQSSYRNLSNSYIKSESSGLIENGVCHGSIGLVYLFSNLHDYFGDKEFLKAREYWLLNSFNKNEKLISRNYIFESNDWVENGTLLSGYCGMGISLLNYHNKECDGLNRPLLIW